jgi:hypothetical protein
LLQYFDDDELSLWKIFEGFILTYNGIFIMNLFTEMDEE